MRELVVFVHGMANFSHNRTQGGIGEKGAQERLIRKQLGSNHTFLGAFDDSGNFAFLTEKNPIQLKVDVLKALNMEYEVKGAVTVERDRLQGSLDNLVTLCRQIYGEQFQASDNLVWKAHQPWRLGMVFVQELYDKRIGTMEGLHTVPGARTELLTVQEGIIGVLKFDPKRPRIPWGEPAQTVECILARIDAKWRATGRSARTVRGVLTKFLC